MHKNTIKINMYAYTNTNTNTHTHTHTHTYTYTYTYTHTQTHDKNTHTYPTSAILEIFSMKTSSVRNSLANENTSERHFSTNSLLKSLYQYMHINIDINLYIHIKNQLYGSYPIFDKELPMGS